MFIVGAISGLVTRDCSTDTSSCPCAVPRQSIKMAGGAGALYAVGSIRDPDVERVRIQKKGVEERHIHGSCFGTVIKTFDPMYGSNPATLVLDDMDCHASRKNRPVTASRGKVTDARFCERFVITVPTKGCQRASTPKSEVCSS